jgi:hypothetical protein
MFPIAADTALNLLWLAIGVLAVFFLSRVERRYHPGSTTRARRQRLFAILILTLALFPSVSSSDDLFSFSLINTHLGKHGGFGGTLPEDSKEKAGIQLFRLLETLNHYQIAQVFTVSLALCCLALVLTLWREPATRSVLCRPGRAPPLA